MHFLSLFLFFFVYQADGQYYIGDPCTQNGQNGVCRNIRVCQSAVKQIAMRKPPLTCSFQGSEPVVCCFDAETAVATPPPPRPTQASTEYVQPSYDYTSNGGSSSDGCEPLSPSMTSQKTGRKAWDKCIEYQIKYVYPCEKGVALSGDKVRANHCGHNADELVVGGVDAKYGEFPHMALLGYGNDPDSAQWLCGGTILSEKFVMTAGHCTSNRDDIEVTFVRTATLRRTSRLDSRRLYRVARVIKHPQYDPPKKYNDIALLETQTAMLLDTQAVPACLPIGSSYNDTKASAIGFGATEYRGKSADNLQKVTLTKFPTKECSEKFQPERLMMQGFQENTQMCFGDRSMSKDTCQGDSGGPLQINNKDVHCMFTVVGVTSFGRACGFVGEPGMYTRVAFYTPWIESVIWPN